jgi:hypothetical protein
MFFKGLAYRNAYKHGGTTVVLLMLIIIGGWCDDCVETVSVCMPLPAMYKRAMAVLLARA